MDRIWVGVDGQAGPCMGRCMVGAWVLYGLCMAWCVITTHNHTSALLCHTQLSHGLYESEVAAQHRDYVQVLQLTNIFLLLIVIFFNHTFCHVIDNI